MGDMTATSAMTLAIVGRPNAGKSTLFNRMIGRRAALVDEMPGLTRDLRQGVCLLGGAPFTLIDTAGLDDARSDKITQLMTKQAITAIEAADLILFLFDARAGITPEDELWARFVRKKAKRILLVANKCENQQRTQSGQIDALRFGFGDAVAISAEHNLGLSTLEEEIVKHLPEINRVDAAPASKRSLNMAIIGRPNSGKSSLVNHLLGQPRMLAGPQPGLTRDSIPISWQWRGQKIELFDTAGLRRPARIFQRAEELSVSSALQAIRFADVVVLLMDAMQLFEKQDLRIADLIAREGRAPVLAVNKMDLTPDLVRKEIIARADELLPQLRGVPLVCFSVKTGQGVDSLMPQAIRAFDMWKRELTTGVLNAWLKACIARHPPPSSRGRPVRIKYITQKSSRPPTFVIFTTRAKRLPESYKRFLINDMRASFGFDGTPIRLDVRASTNPYASG